ncbi:diacylglycerol kinase family protein [Paraflavisolibacter sp. H34]|uniref:diacylglycerol/lipid kinase family protein n=1 Tax=Huijunlia imazamoxiresistens TaxID=3127457 RepID=UPI003018C14D
MQKEEAQKLLFLINPVSGGKNKQNWEAVIRNYFRDLPHHPEIFILTGKGDPVSVRHHLQTVKPDKVVAVGGDGTIKLAAEQLLNSGIPLGIIPAGSANGMARELGIPLRLEEALKIVLDGNIHDIDAIRINGGEICLHLSDIGLNANLVKHFEDSDQRGMWAYGRGLVKVLYHKSYMHVTLQTDTETIRRKAFMVVLANARTYGTGAVINPEGNLEDGRFEVVVVRKLNLIELLKMLVTHKPFDPDKIEIFHARSLEVSLYRKAYFQVDGEYRGKIRGLTAEILPACLRMILPG